MDNLSVPDWVAIAQLVFTAITTIVAVATFFRDKK